VALKQQLANVQKHNSEQANWVSEKESCLEKVREYRTFKSETEDVRQDAKRYYDLLAMVGPVGAAQWFGSIEKVPPKAFSSFLETNLVFELPKAGSAKAVLNVPTKFINPAMPPELRAGSGKSQADSVELDMESGLGRVVFLGADKLRVTMEASGIDTCEVVIAHREDDIVIKYRIAEEHDEWYPMPATVIVFSPVSITWGGTAMTRTDEGWSVAKGS
jgi:hypothetical protein